MVLFNASLFFFSLFLCFFSFFLPLYITYTHAYLYTGTSYLDCSLPYTNLLLVFPFSVFPSCLSVLVFNVCCKKNPHTYTRTQTHNTCVLNAPHRLRSVPMMTDWPLFFLPFSLSLSLSFSVYFVSIFHRQKSGRNGAHMPRDDIAARGPHPHGRLLHLRHLERRHADIPHQGRERGRAAVLGDGARAGQSEGNVTYNSCPCGRVKDVFGY